MIRTPGALAAAPQRTSAAVTAPAGVQHEVQSARAFRSGARAMAAMTVGYVPFGLLVGAAVAGSDEPLAAWLATWTIYGGAAHLAVLDVVDSGAGVLGAALVGLTINARLAAYSASLAPDWRGVPARRRLLAALALTDAPWALAQNTAGDARERRARFAGAALVLWFAWPVLVTLGVLAGHLLQDVPAARILPGLTLGFLVVPQLRHRPGLVAATVAAATTVLCASLPAGPALLSSAAAGAAAAAVVHRSSS